jgi:NAD(P)-dependent dehydrogenase (short-subunit alcohol dehydrogenase family)
MKEKSFPGQHQDLQPGKEFSMNPEPLAENHQYVASGKLKDKVAIITGGDSGIGEAVALLFAKEGADIAIAYKEEHGDAEHVRMRVEQLGRKCLLLAGDIGDEHICRLVVEKTVDKFKRIDILVNNAAEQHVRKEFEDIRFADLDRVFKTNIYSMFFMVREVLGHMRPGSAIVNTTSVTAYKGNPLLIDYSTTKGAIVAFTRSLSLRLISKGIRVNAVAPGPVWTPLIPSSFESETVEQFGKNTPMGRAGQPYEIAPSYLFLATDDSLYVNGQVLHPNGGTVING